MRERERQTDRDRQRERERVCVSEWGQREGTDRQTEREGRERVRRDGTEREIERESLFRLASPCTLSNEKY